MLLDGVFTRNDILEAGMQASALRNDVILNNIANAETPEYKKKSVKFESLLSEQINSAISEGRLDISRLDLSAADPIIQTDNSTLKYRLDGNNVDIDVEMVALYQNSVRYDVIVSSVMNNYQRINAVLASR